MKVEIKMNKKDIFPEGIPIEISIRELKRNLKEQGYFPFYLLVRAMVANHNFLKNRGIL